MEKELIILAIYINVSGQSRNRAEQMIYDFIKNHEDAYKDINKDVKVYYFPSDETRVDCVYPPPNIAGDSNVVENELLKIYKLLLNSENGEAKELIRHIEKKLKLSSLIQKTKESIS